MTTSTSSLPWRSAPRASARSRRSGRGSRAQTASTARAWAAAMASRPLVPQPTTSRLSPARRPQRSKARSTQASGSTKVARSASRPSRTSSSSTRSAGTRTRSAKPPGSRPVALKRSHSVSWPRRQRRHSPHGAWWCTTTRSPTATPSTSWPTAMTSPASSWPRTVGTLRATQASRTSEPQTPQASTRQTTSPPPGSGSAACSTRTSRGVSERATLMPAGRRWTRRRAAGRRRARSPAR